MPIVLESGDKIQGAASSSGQVDYLIFGLKGDNLSRLASGSLPSTVNDLYTATGTDTVTTIVLVNTGDEENYVQILLKPAGQSAVYLIPRNLKLGPGYSLYTDGKTFSVLDTSGGLQ